MLRCGPPASRGRRRAGRSRPPARAGPSAGLDDHAVAGPEPAGDQPLVADGAPGHQRALLQPALAVDHVGDRLARAVAAHRGLGHQQRLVEHALLDDGARIHARQQLVARIRELGAQRHRARALVHRDVGELQPARERVAAAVLQDEAHRRRAALHDPRGQGALQGQQRGAGLRHIDVDRIELLHRGHGARLVRGDERAGRHGGAADAPADRRRDAGVVEVDALGLQRGPGRIDLGLGLQERGGGVVRVLLAHGLDGRQLLEAPGLELHRNQAGLGLGERGARVVHAGAVGGGIDQVEQLARLDVAALLESALLHQAGDLRAHLGDQGRGHAAGQLGGQRHRPLLQGDHADPGRPLGARHGRARRLAAAGNR